MTTIVDWIFKKRKKTDDELRSLELGEVGKVDRVVLLVMA